MEYSGEADLSGDELKMVTYSIIYREADHEAILHAAETVVDYETTENSFKVLTLSEFLKSLNDGISIPASWRDGNQPAGDFGYSPDDQSPQTFSTIPQGKRKYLDVMLQVVARHEKAEERNAAAIHALNEIAEQIGKKDQE